MPQFASIARPLITMTEKNSKFKWTDNQEGAWEKLKEKLTSPPILVYPDPETASFLTWMQVILA